MAKNGSPFLIPEASLHWARSNGFKQLRRCDAQEEALVTTGIITGPTPMSVVHDTIEEALVQRARAQDEAQVTRVVDEGVNTPDDVDELRRVQESLVGQQKPRKPGPKKRVRHRKPRKRADIAAEQLKREEER